MKINWLILLNVALVQPFMLRGADNTGISAANSKTLITITQSPLNKEQITALAQQAVANCITSQTQKYAKTLQKKLVALLTFRSKAQPAHLISQNIAYIINQQSLELGYIQGSPLAGTFSTSSTVNKQSWWQLFKNKLLIESANEQAEITWAHEVALLLVQYWPILKTYCAQKNRKFLARKRKQADDLVVEETQELLRKNRRHNESPIPFVPMADEQTPASQRPASALDLLIHSNHEVHDTAFFPEIDTNSAASSGALGSIAQAPLSKEQITALAQQAIASCITSQTCGYEATLQKKLATLLAFHSQLQPVNLRNQSARFIINRKNLDHGYIQTNQHAGIISSSSASSKQSWSALFRNKLLIESTGEQAEIAWAHEIASLLVQYWPTYTAYMAQKHRERTTRKREQPYDSVEGTRELLRKNRRHNDSPVPFVPVADEQISVSQTPASTSFDLLMHSNHDALDAVSFSEVDPDSMVYFDPPTPIFDDLFSDKRT